MVGHPVDPMEEGQMVDRSVNLMVGDLRVGRMVGRSAGRMVGHWVDRLVLNLHLGILLILPRRFVQRQLHAPHHR